MTTAHAISIGARSSVMLALLVIGYAAAAGAQEESTKPAVAEQAPVAEEWGERVDRLIEQISDFEKDSSDADDLYYELGQGAA